MNLDKLSVFNDTKSSEELLSDLLNYDAKKLLSIHPLYNGLVSLYYLDEHLMLENNVPTSVINKVLALQEVSKRLHRDSKKELVKADKPESVVEYYKEHLRTQDRECFVLVLLNSQNGILRDYIVNIGTNNCSVVDTAFVLRKVLNSTSTNFIILHNHPSGHTNPSNSDVEITMRIRDGAKLLGLNLLDSIIIGDNKFYSFKQEGRL